MDSMKAGKAERCSANGSDPTVNSPRALLVEGFNSGWFDAKGEWLSCRAAAPVWEFLGKGGLPKGDFPENYDRSRIGASFGYVRRGGQHGISGYDWLWMLDFSDNAFAK